MQLAKGLGKETEPTACSLKDRQWEWGTEELRPQGD